MRGGESVALEWGRFDGGMPRGVDRGMELAVVDEAETGGTFLGEGVLRAGWMGGAGERWRGLLPSWPASVNTPSLVGLCISSIQSAQLEVEVSWNE